MINFKMSPFEEFAKKNTYSKESHSMFKSIEIIQLFIRFDKFRKAVLDG